MPQVETAKVEAKLKEAEALLANVTDPNLKSQCDRDSDGTKKQSKPWDHG